ncbi:MAG: protein-glutamate O-methyltransferase CheR [Caulobacterales bacterium]|nr:protein-glutamate O-methyltransferase CheR [Caulobacterales bacterium]
MAQELDFPVLSALMSERAGYDLGLERLNAVEARLGPIARREGLASVQALISLIDPVQRPSLSWEIVEAILPADTRFFRDRDAFQLLSGQLLPALAKARGGKVRILSAGCATGQEAWSIAICAAEVEVEVEVIALDLSMRAIEKARAGVYTQFEVQRGLRARQLVEWFGQTDDLWHVSSRLKPAVQFDRANLLDGLEGLGGFDLIFCRHVLAEMTREARQRVIAGLGRALGTTGCLFLGAGETLPEAEAVFRPVAGFKSVYVRSASPISRAA